MPERVVERFALGDAPAEEPPRRLTRVIFPFANSLSRRRLKLPSRGPERHEFDGGRHEGCELSASGAGAAASPPARHDTAERSSNASDARCEQTMVQDALAQAEERSRQLADEFAESNRRRDQFLAVLSHELRNPLAPILAAVQVLRHDTGDGQANRQARNVIERQVRQLASLIDDLLDSSRFAAGKMRLRKEPIELQVVLQRALESARPQIEARQHHLVVSLPAESIWLHADPMRLEQVFLNLLNNAAKYTRNGGRIAVTAQRQGSEAIITVEDSGTGIPCHMLSDIFELFTQAHQSQTPSQAGLGIGLALVKQLVELHGGGVTAESDGAERGSRFIIRLPSSMAAAPEVGELQNLLAAVPRCSDD